MKPAKWINAFSELLRCSRYLRVLLAPHARSQAHIVTYSPASDPTMHQVLIGFKLVLLIALLVFACLPTVGRAAEKTLIGISLPTNTPLQLRWKADGAHLTKVFSDKGYGTEVRFANNDVATQLNDFDAMIGKGVKILVITPIDSSALNQVLQKAADKNIKIIAYDRLIRNTPNVDYYATFDNYQVGVLQAAAIEKVLALKSAKRPFNIELFAGSADDNNAHFVFNGAMSLLRPYLENGKLIVRSKQIDFKKSSHLALGLGGCTGPHG